MTNLIDLDLDMNLLDGHLPTEMGLMASLDYLHLEWNSLSGTLPTEMGQLTRLELLNLGENSLKGTIPEFLGALPHLDLINLYESGLAGTVPDSFCSSNRTRFLVVDCELTTECSCCTKNNSQRHLYPVYMRCGEDLKDFVLEL